MIRIPIVITWDDDIYQLTNKQAEALKDAMEQGEKHVTFPPPDGRVIIIANIKSLNYKEYWEPSDGSN